MSVPRKITYRDAVREAIQDAMHRDPRVFLMGEDVGRYGGAYGCSKGLLAEFGEERIRDTPLAEAGFARTSSLISVFTFSTSFCLSKEAFPTGT